MKEQIEQLLAALGSTASEVADTLGQANIRGVRNTVRYLNPIVRYVQETLRIDDYMVDIWTSQNSQDTLRVNSASGIRLELALPRGVNDFLEQFDRGDYPDLELPGTDGRGR